MNPNIISRKRNEWIKQIWIDQLPQICTDVGFTPDWALRAPLWTHPDDFDNEKPIVVHQLSKLLMDIEHVKTFDGIMDIMEQHVPES